MRVRTYLTALVLLPLLGLGGFAGFHVRERLQTADDAHQVVSDVTNASLDSRIRLHVLDEILPALTLTVFRDTALKASLGMPNVLPAAIGLSDQVIADLRNSTDAALAQAVANGDTRSAALRFRSTLTHARADIDIARPTSIVSGQTAFLDLAAALAKEETSTVERARSHPVDAGLATALSDLEMVSTAAEEQSLVMQEVASIQFAAASSATALEALQWWGSARTASAVVLSNASAQVATAWRHAMTSPAATQLDRTISSVLTTHTSLDFATLGRLFLLNATRTKAVFGVGATVDDRAVQAANGQQASARRDALIAAGAAGLVVLLSVLVTIGIRRRIARPLLDLASLARQISEGEFVLVDPRGPREVQTVANGLSAAVENLRKVSAQAAAVASGDLSSDIVQTPLPGALGAVMHESVSAMVDAIHDRDAARVDLAHRAAHDALTELPNRVGAMESIVGALHRATRSGSMTAVMFVDLDNFKMVNDTFGHSSGDMVLQASSRRMLAGVRGGDQVFRLGGDEFVVLLENIETEMACVQIAERLIESLSAPIDVERARATIGASIGIAFSRDASVDAERLLSEADAAVYRAKQSGRGRVGIFDNDLRATLSARAELGAAIAAGIDHNEFVLYYQPIVELSSGRMIGTEALMRWNRPGFGLVMPDDFIPTAEGSVLINRLGVWSLIEATAQLARWDHANGEPSDQFVSVNISGRHLLSTHLVDEVRDALDRSGIAAQRLLIELTETVVVDDPIATTNMSRLRQLGVGIAIDDFGTGYTSIGQLPYLPIDKLKIDQSFVASTDPGHRKLVRLIVAAAQAFGLTVVAEGIEIAQQADDMEAAGVETGQGYFFARPAPPASSNLSPHAAKHLSIGV